MKLFKDMDSSDFIWLVVIIAGFILFMTLIIVNPDSQGYSCLEEEAYREGYLLGQLDNSSGVNNYGTLDWNGYRDNYDSGTIGFSLSIESRDLSTEENTERE